MNEQDARIREAIIDQATDWYVRHREGSLTAAQKEEFLQWLRASLQHTSEYLAIARLSGSLRAAVAELKLDPARLMEQIQGESHEAPVWLKPMSPRPPDRLKSRNYLRIALVPLTVVVLLGASALYWLTAPGFAGLPRSITVAHGEQRTVQLSDGSVAHINANSQLRVRFSHAQRLVELDQGEAMFDVAHDTTKPFRVLAGSTEVTAVGTEFDVYRRSSQEVTVTVVQGKVDVVDHDVHFTPAVRGTNNVTPPAVRVVAGQQLHVIAVRNPATRPALAAEPVDVRAATAWIRREVVFEGRPLREVTAEFNRYTPKPIDIEDPELSDLQVSGAFNAYDTDSFLAFLRQFDVQVREDNSAIHIERRTKH